MGPIQSSINQLTGTAWATIAAAGTMAKKIALPNAKKTANTPKSEVTNSMGNNVKIGRVPRNQYAKAASLIAANNVIEEKAPSVMFNIGDRIAEATASSISSSMIGGKK